MSDRRLAQLLGWLARSGRWLIVAVLLVCRPEPAQADQASEAQLQFELGSELYKQGRYMEAIDRFVASNRLAPNPNVVLNVAQTFVFLERPLEAYNWYSTYLAFQLEGDKRAQAEAARAALQPDVAVLDVSSEPAGAELFIDRLELGSPGRTPRKLAVEPGTHRIVARATGYHDAEARLQVERGKTTAQRLTLLAIVGALEVRSQPLRASVRLEPGAKDLGVTPLSALLPVGEHRITISAPGYLEQNRTVTIREGTPAALDVKLSREASSVSVLSVKGNVPGARVLLDQLAVGTAPISVPDVTPGTRLVTIVAEGREPWSGRVLFEPGAATRVDYHLLDPRTRPWKGWRYLGYGLSGALLASSGVTGLFAIKAKGEVNREPTAAALSRLHTLNTGADLLLASGLVVGTGTLVWDLLTANEKSGANVTLSR